MNGILERSLYELVPPRYEYRLTKNNAGLFPHSLYLMPWADEWLADVKGPPVIVHHRLYGHLLGASVICGECGEVLPDPGYDHPAPAVLGDSVIRSGVGRRARLGKAQIRIVMPILTGRRCATISVLRTERKTAIFRICRDRAGCSE